jgi:hypothetical protein
LAWNTLDRTLNTAADNLRIAKILIQLGLDPNNITYDANGHSIILVRLQT